MASSLHRWTTPRNIVVRKWICDHASMLHLYQAILPSTGLPMPMHHTYRLYTQVVYPMSMSEYAKDFIGACLRKHPGDRPTVMQMLSMPWIQMHQVRIGLHGSRMGAAGGMQGGSIVAAWKLHVSCMEAAGGMRGGSKGAHGGCTWVPHGGCMGQDECRMGPAWRFSGHA